MNPALARIRQWAPSARPHVGVVLGSGWGGLVQRLADGRRIGYADLTGFGSPGVAGHAGQLWLGRCGAHQVAVLSGRRHVYEDGDAAAMAVPVRTLRAMGCELLVLTNAAGSLHAQMPAGSLMLMTDHLNLPQRSPLVGETGSERFVDMTGAYDAELRALARAVAARRGETLHEGVYAWFLGPQFETPAEIRMAGLLGADAVGMSTVPETILARHAGMRVLGLSLITNLAAGLSGEALSHAHTLAQAQAAAERAAGLLADIIEALP